MPEKHKLIKRNMPKKSRISPLVPINPWIKFIGLKSMNRTHPNIRIDKHIKFHGNNNHDVITIHAMKSQGIQNDARWGFALCLIKETPSFLIKKANITIIATNTYCMLSNTLMSLWLFNYYSFLSLSWTFWLPRFLYVPNNLCNASHPFRSP